MYNLTYSNYIYYYVSKDNSFREFNLSSIKNHQSALALETDKYINSKIIKNYKTFLSIIKNEHDIKITKKIIIFKQSRTFIFLRQYESNHDKSLELIAAYKPEVTDIEKILDIVFSLNSKNTLCISCNIHNYFSLVLPPEVYGVLLSDASIRSRGENTFHKFKLRSKSGKIRDIIAPHDEIKPYLQDLNILFQNIYDSTNEDFQVAYKKGKNIISNARHHSENKYVMNIDLCDFYPSCKRELVEPLISFLFSGFAFNNNIKNKFLDIILDNDALFIGSPISGCLANMVISKPVAYMKNICDKFGVEFSVYADDMTFSSDRYISRDFVNGVFKRAFDEYGLSNYFSINPKKFKAGTSTGRHITGVSFDEQNRTTGRRVMYRNIRAAVFSLSQGKSVKNIQKLRGQISFMLMLEEGDKLKKYLNKFSDTVEKYNLCSPERYV